MSKVTVTRLFIGSGIAIVAGAILGVVAVWLAIANDVFVMSGSDVVGIQGSALAWTLIGLGIAGGVAMVGGALGGLISWIGALLNTWQLDEQDLVRGAAPARDLQPRVLRDGRLPGRRTGWDERRPAPTGAGSRRGMMTGKTVLVTGATGGIGLAAASRLAAQGARVGITGRDRTRAEEAAAGIARASGSKVDVFVADMSSQAEVRRLAGEVLATYPRLDVLLNNVGGFWAHRHLTADGLEHTFALNHLAPFLLTNLLLDRLTASAPARVVTVSSGAQAMGRIDFDDLMGERSWSGQRAYSQSKLANVMFTYELARRTTVTGVTATTLHPGVTRTGFGAEDPTRLMAPVIAVLRPFMRSPERGADTAVYLASSPDVEGLTGRYFADRKVKTSNKVSYDAAAAARLWTVSAQLVGLPVDASS